MFRRQPRFCLGRFLLYYLLSQNSCSILACWSTMIFSKVKAMGYFTMKVESGE